MSAINKSLDDNFLSKRIHSRIESLLTPQLDLTDIAQIYCSSSDEGVVRNGGRFGTRYGAQSIMTQLGKLNFAHSLLGKKIGTTHISHWSRPDPFEETEKRQIETLAKDQKFSGRKIHLGGGHDHFYSLIASLVKNGSKSLHIVNLDPHLDTRVDELPHSGNHLRRIAKDFSNLDLKIFQIGALRAANDKVTTESVDKKIMEIIWREQWSDDEKWQKALIEKIYPPDFKGQLVISFDADMVEASEMQAVSAVAYRGITFEKLAQFIFKLDAAANRKSVLGIYEYNPLYENLSCTGACKIAWLVSEFLF